MFERFSKEARAAVVAAQEVARDARSRQIDTRHLLVALLRASAPVRSAVATAGADPVALARSIAAGMTAGGLDEAALASVGIDLDEVLRHAEETFGPGSLDGAGRGRRGHIPFGRDGRKALELALRETLRLGGRSIDGGKLLLGMLRADCPGRAALVTAGVDLARLRTALEHPDAA